MNRDALGPALVAVLAVVALGVGASVLDTSADSGGATGIGGGSGGIGVGEGSTFSLGQPPPIDSSGDGLIPKIVLQLLAALVFGAFLVGLYVLRDELGLRDLGVVVVTSLVLAGVLLLVYLGLSFFGSGGQRNATGSAGISDDRPLALPGGGGSLDGAARTVTPDPPILALLVGVALVVGVFALVRSTGTDDSTPESEPEVNEPEPVNELGRAAGRAADRIADDADPTNEVYRAWQEMTDHLDVERSQSSTPGEFARAAAAAGMAREDVNELTDLFRTVRYGGSDATGERETRAVAALRRIEDEYGEES